MYHSGVSQRKYKLNDTFIRWNLLSKYIIHTKINKKVTPVLGTTKEK